MKPNLVISCPATSRSGYGDHSRDLIRSLIAMDKFNIQILDQRWGSCGRDALTSKDTDISSRIARGKMESQPDIWIQVTVPNEFNPIGKFNIGITAGMETTMVSPEWLQGINRMDYILVPSKHSKEVFEKTEYEQKDNAGNVVSKLKCETKIDILFEGLDMEVFNKKPKTKFDLDIKEDFAFLFVGHWLPGEFGHDRKDVGGMIRTFLETFKNASKRNQPALILKTSSAGFSVGDREQILKKIAAVKKSVGSEGLPNIYLIHGDLTQEELNGLYNNDKVRAMISFTHGEGFGRPLLEFSVTGKPVLYSNWSGHIDFLSEHEIPLIGELQDIHKSAVVEKMLIPESKWFYVNYGYASGAIKDVYKNYKKHLQKSRKQTQYVKDNFTLDKMTELFTTQLKNNVPSFEIKIPKLEEI
jgi:hypothetical protein